MSKFKVGELVSYRPTKTLMAASSGGYQVVRIQPTEGREPTYRIKSITEVYERIANESDLKRSMPNAA